MEKRLEVIGKHLSSPLDYSIESSHVGGRDASIKSDDDVVIVAAIRFVTPISS
jgi:hypothetical protein